MSKVNYIERSKFEKLFGMSSGYVLYFSDRTFQEFIADAIKVDICDEEEVEEIGTICHFKISIIE